MLTIRKLQAEAQCVYSSERLSPLNGGSLSRQKGGFVVSALDAKEVQLSGGISGRAFPKRDNS